MIGTKQIIKCASLYAKMLNDMDIRLNLICKPVDKLKLKLTPFIICEQLQSIRIVQIKDHVLCRDKEIMKIRWWCFKLGLLFKNLNL